MPFQSILLQHLHFPSCHSCLILRKRILPLAPSIFVIEKSLLGYLELYTLLRESGLVSSVMLLSKVAFEKYGQCAPAGRGSMVLIHQLADSKFLQKHLGFAGRVYFPADCNKK